MKNSFRLSVLTAVFLLIPFTQAYANNVHNVELVRDYLTLNDALADTDLADGHTLVLDPGTYNEEAFTNDKNITIRSIYESDPTAVANTVISIQTTLSGPTGTPVHMTAGTLDGLTIADSYAATAFVVDLSGTAIIKNSVVRDNTANYDGSGIVVGGQAQALNNLVSNNAAGGIFGGALGLGIYAYGDALVMGNIIENHVPYTATAGVAIFAYENARIISNVIRGNSGGGFSDTIVDIGDSVVFSNNTVVRNRLDEYATDIIFVSGDSNGMVSNNIFAFNRGKGMSLGYLNLAPATNNLVYGNTLGDGDIGDNAIQEDPQLDADGIHLLPGSPAIDAGINTSQLSSELDIDGEARIQNNTVDIGADELTSDSAPAGLVMSVNGGCPRADSLSISGATPGGKVIILGSTETGDGAVPNGSCTGTALGLLPPYFKIESVYADANGEILLAPAPLGACRAHIQAIDTENCVITDVLTSPLLGSRKR